MPVAEELLTFLSDERTPGQAFASEEISVGVFDERGGLLKIQSEERYEIDIPPGALNSGPQLIYIIVKCEPVVKITNASFSPVIDCGPRGLEFKVGSSNTLLLWMQYLCKISTFGSFFYNIQISATREADGCPCS